MGLFQMLTLIQLLISLEGYFVTPNLENEEIQLEPFTIDYDEDVNNQSFLLNHDSGELKPNFEINYQKLYRLRFDPTKLGRRNFKVTQNEYDDEMNHYPHNNKQQLNQSEIPDDVETFDPETLTDNPEDTNGIDSIDDALTTTTTTTTESNQATSSTTESNQATSSTTQSNQATSSTTQSNQATSQTPETNTQNITTGTDFNSTLPTQGVSIRPSYPLPENIHNFNSNVMNLRPTFPSTLTVIKDKLKNLIFGSNDSITKTYSNPSSKFLSLFTVVKFENGECSVSTMRDFTGICYNDEECKQFGGMAMGSCASGFGVCCVFKFSCSDKTNQKISYFESPNYPLANYDALSCIFTVELRKNVGQLLLEFLTFELRRPTEGNCDQDQFIISGQSRNFQVPELCGLNSGQHMYVNVETAAERRIFLSVFAKSYDARAFSVKITQLESNLAPDGCLQYHKEPSGYIKSFNYDEAGGIIVSRTGSYLNNLNYAICVKRDKVTCTIAYANEPGGIELPFQMVNVDEYENLIVANGQAGADIFNCPDDYITIGSLRLCGNKLNDGRTLEDFGQNTVITDSQMGPIVIPVRTDDRIVGRGFKLFYIQEYCA